MSQQSLLKLMLLAVSDSAALDITHAVDYLAICSEYRGGAARNKSRMEETPGR